MPISHRLAAIFLAAAATGAEAQAIQQPSSHVEAVQPARPHADASKQKHLLGDWNKGFSDQGIDLNLSYEGDLGAAISGGKSDGVDFAQQGLLRAKFDWEKIAGLKGLSSTVTLVNRSGQSVSHHHIGDQLFQVETIYGGTHHAPIHLVDAYFDWKSAAGKFDIAAGRLFVGNDFATSPYYCEFMNTSVCGYPNGLAMKRGFTAFPNSTWGTRLRVAAGSKFYFQAGAYQVRPGFGGKWGFDWGWSGTTGAYFPVEIGWEPSFGPNELNGHYKVGFTTDTSRYEDLLTDANGGPFPISGNPPAKRNSRHSLYVLADQMLHRNGDGPQNGLVVFGGFVTSDKATSRVNRFAFAAIRDKGLIASRPDDISGIMVAHAQVNRRLTIEQRLSGDPPQTGEWAVEGIYNIAITDGLSLTPDIQYLVHPNAEKSIPNALAIAGRVQVNF